MLFDFEQTLAFEHHGQDIGGGDIARIVQLDQLAQQRFGVLPLNGVNPRHGRFINAVPIRDEAFAVARAVAVLLLPAGPADVRAVEIGLLIEKQRVISLLIGKSFAAGPARVAARLNIPLSHEKSPDR